MPTTLDPGAQYEWNLKSAQESARINRINTKTPWGSVTHRGTPGEDGYRQEVTLDPSQMETLKLLRSGQHIGANEAYNRLLGYASQFKGTMNPAHYGKRGAPLTPGMLPGMGTPLGQTGIGLNAPGLDHGSIQAVEKSVYDRGAQMLAPQFARAEDRSRTRLANQGIAGTSRAGMSEMGRVDRSRQNALNDLALQAVMAGRQEHSRLGAEARQNTGLRAGLHAQDFGQRQDLRHGEARLAGQSFAEHEASRQNAIAQEMAIRNQAIGEIGAFRQMGQITPPPIQPSGFSGVQPVAPHSQNTPWWERLLHGSAPFGSAWIMSR